jgi:riboflavin kinase/FMN adenylyltransferase
MLNQGPKPTFHDAERSLEAHLFNVSDELYGEWVKVEWVKRLRDVQRFDSAAELVQQIQRDRERAEKVLAAARKTSAA